MTDSKHRNPQGMGFDTLSLHAGQVPDPTTGARATPIYQSAAFVFPDSDAAAGLFNIERAGHVYSRLSNPTNAVLEERMAALDHGVGSVVTASGQAAFHLAINTFSAPVITSYRRDRSMAALITCSSTPCRVSGSQPPLLILATCGLRRCDSAKYQADLW